MTSALQRAPVYEEPRAAHGRPLRPFASVERCLDMDAARMAWAILQVSASPYQSFAFVEAWAQAFSAETIIIVARDEAGAAVALLPMDRRRLGPLRVARLAGGAWSNFALGLFRNGADWRGEDISALLVAAAANAEVDLFAFAHMPLQWNGRDNPLCRLSFHRSPNSAFASALPASHAEWFDAHFSRSTQKKQRKKLRKLEVFGEVAHARATNEAQALLFLDALFAQRAAQAQARGEANEFAAREVRELLRRLVACGSMEMHALKAGERVAAVFGALSGARRLSGLVVSYDGDPQVSAASPGEWLLIEVVRDAIARGFKTFDLGVGQSRYKSEICEVEVPLYDIAFAITRLGRLGAAIYLGARATHGWLKRRPRLIRLAKRLRRPFSARR